MRDVGGRHGWGQLGRSRAVGPPLPERVLCIARERAPERGAAVEPGGLGTPDLGAHAIAPRAGGCGLGCHREEAGALRGREGQRVTGWQRRQGEDSPREVVGGGVREAHAFGRGIEVGREGDVCARASAREDGSLRAHEDDGSGSGARSHREQAHDDHREEEGEEARHPVVLARPANGRRRVAGAESLIACTGMSKTPLTQDEIASIRALRALAATGTHYGLLGLATSASQAEIDAAWQAFARKWHPDRFYARDAGDLSTVLEDNFAAAFKAFRALSDATKRLTYDRELAAAGKLVGPGSGVSSGGGGGPTPLRNASPGVPSAPPPRVGAPAAVQRAHAAALERVQRARASIAEARQDMKDAKWSKAEGSLKMALTFDPGNPDATALLQEVSNRAGEQRARTWLAQARAEEEIGRQREALVLYKRAAEYELPDADGYVRLGKLLLQLDNDERGAVNAFRKAALKAPRQADVHLLLADAYERVGLGTSARREAEVVLGIDPRNEAAKALLKRVR